VTYNFTTSPFLIDEIINIKLFLYL